RCQASITIVKLLEPENDPGRFSLEIDGEVAGGASSVGNGGTTGSIAVDAGQRTVGESANPGTELSNYDTQIGWVRGDEQIASATGPSVNVSVSKGDQVVCTITNTRKNDLKPVRPMLECVIFRDNKPDRAIWGYENENAFPVTLEVGGPENAFTPAPAN